MPSNWEVVKLEDVAVELTVGHVGPMATEYVESGVPFLRSLNVEALRINTKDLKFITPEFHNRLQKSRLRPGDVVIVRTGKPGTCSVIPDWLADANCSDLVIVRCGERLDSRFLAYYVNTVSVGHVAAHAVGAVQQHFNVGSARTIQIHLPPIDEQQRIATILGNLDDRIELNGRMNATLEAMARALFQSWFVDFDPVRAKLDGSAPVGMPAPTAAFFSSAFQETSFGNVPKGWRVGRLGELLSFGRESLNPADYAGETFEHYSLPAYDNSATPAVEIGADILSNKLVVPEQAVLLSKLNPHIPRIWLPDLHDERRSVCSTEFLVAQPKPDIPTEYLFALFTSGEFLGRYRTLVTGTTGSHQRVHASAVLDMNVTTPPLELMNAFSSIVGPLFKKCRTNRKESRTLANIRDALLPKLLSEGVSMHTN